MSGAAEWFEWEGDLSIRAAEFLKAVKQKPGVGPTLTRCDPQVYQQTASANREVVRPQRGRSIDV